jgi:hypothetical protein
VADGGPTDRLGDDEEDENGGRDGDSDGETPATHEDVGEWEFADPQSPQEATTATDRDADAGEAPLGDLADRLRRRREDRDADADAAEDPFEEVAVSEVDSEAVWEALEADSTDDDVGALGRDDPLAPDSAVERVDSGDGGTSAPEFLVPKREFCHQCPHFSAPPTVACTHEGTAIVEVADTDHFRVRNCPVVDSSGDDR